MKTRTYSWSEQPIFTCHIRFQCRVQLSRKLPVVTRRPTRAVQEETRDLMSRRRLVTGIDFKIKTVELGGKKIKLQIW